MNKKIFSAFFLVFNVLIIVKFILNKNGRQAEADVILYLIIGYVLSYFIHWAITKFFPKWFHSNKPTREEIEIRVHGEKS